MFFRRLSSVSPSFTLSLKKNSREYCLANVRARARVLTSDVYDMMRLARARVHRAQRIKSLDRFSFLCAHEHACDGDEFIPHARLTPPNIRCSLTCVCVVCVSVFVRARSQNDAIAYYVRAKSFSMHRVHNRSPARPELWHARAYGRAGEV